MVELYIILLNGKIATNTPQNLHNTNSESHSRHARSLKLIKSVCHCQRAARKKPEMRQRSDESVQMEVFKSVVVIVCQELQSYKDLLFPSILILSTPG